MGKLQLKKPRIITKHFPEVESHIDRVNSSLETIVFAYDEQVEKALQKKHLMMLLSTITLVVVVGSFIAPIGKADIATFYPETCLGGWSNPRLAEKEPQTSSNADVEQFNVTNSAVLYKNTNSDIYCGNFQGEFNDATIPKKIIVSFAMTNKEELTLDSIESSSSTLLLSTSSLLFASSTDIITASGTDSVISSSTLLLNASSSESATVETFSVASSSSEEGKEKVNPTTTGSFVDILVNTVTETITDLFNASVPTTAETDTIIITPPQEEVVVPPQQETQPSITPTTEQSSETLPVSFYGNSFSKIFSYFVPKVFAQEVVAEETSSQNQQTTEAVSEIVPEVSTQTEDIATIKEPEIVPVEEVSTTTNEVSNLTTSSTTEASSSTEMLLDFASTTASSSDVLIVASSSETTESTEEATSTQNNFLEIFYTFDGVTWTSLGELNEISMKYRTFEIPLSASSTWTDMSQLQIKVATKSLERETPYVYLDAIKVEVLYEGEIEYTHPDFSRDTIISDETINMMRIVTLINHENNEEEIWYMYLEENNEATEVATTTNSTSTDMQAASTTDVLPEIEIQNKSSVEDKATSTEIQDLIITGSSSESVSSSTEIVATSTLFTTSSAIVPVIQKNKWYKLERKDKVVGLRGQELALAIEKLDKEDLEQEKKEDRLPDFAKDLIKKIKGTLLNAVIIQVEKEGVEELWLYNLETGAQQKIEGGTTTNFSFSKEIGIGMKDTIVFWVSEDKKYVYGYDIVQKVFVQKNLGPFDPSLGEKGRVYFEEFNWTTIIDGDTMVFSREDTGEVFSDDNGALGEVLRQRLELDKILDKEQISNLNLPVDQEDNKEQ